MEAQMKRLLILSILLFHSIGFAQPRSLALIYRGPGACKGCPETVSRLLNKMGMETRYIRPGQFTSDRLSQASLYVQPGGSDYVDDTMKALSKPEVTVLRTYVHDGGRYLGICAGGYLAGEWAEDPDRFVAGFGLIPGPVNEESKNRQARVEPIDWSGKLYGLYFQDGPMFDISHIPGAQIWATYARTGHVAALIAPFGKGRVGLIGPHPEAEEDWFTDDHIQPVDGLHPELEMDLVKALLK